MTLSKVSDAYGARSAEYIEHIGTMDATSETDRDAVLSWALGLTGRVIDVGCGPGQWTSFLFEHGLDIEGVDPTPEFIEAAQRRFPSIRFHIGHAENLDARDGSLGGILSWYSLIHTEPKLIDNAFAEFARCLRPGGGLALGFFEGPELAPFNHVITTAYFWPFDVLAARIESSGFTITEASRREIPGVRTHGFITATRNSS